MLRQIALRIALSRFNPRGKQLLLRCVDNMFGAGRHRTPEGIVLQTEYSNPQTLAFFRQGDNSVLETAIRSLPNGGTFVDIGANIGYYSLLAARIVGCRGRCLAFEPSSREFVSLLANRDTNNANNVVAINCALFEHNTTLDLAISPRHHGLNAIGHIEPTSFSPSRIETVAAFSGDSVVKQLLNRESIDLVKIDVEGAEVKVLCGMRSIIEQRCVSMFCVEITPEYLRRTGDSVDDIYSLMRSAGYSPQVNKADWQFDELFVRD